jgi:hypothetical protein
MKRGSSVLGFVPKYAGNPDVSPKFRRKGAGLSVSSGDNLEAV